MHREEAIAEPGSRKQDEHRQRAQRLSSSLDHGQWLVAAIVTDPRARTMALSRPGPRGRTVLRGAFVSSGLDIRRHRRSRRLRKLGPWYSEHRLLRSSRATSVRCDRGGRRGRRGRRGGRLWLARFARWRLEAEHGVLADSLLRGDAARRLFGRLRLLVHANARLVEPLWSLIAHGVAALAAKRVVGGNSSSTLGTIHDSPVPYQNSVTPAPTGEYPSRRPCRRDQRGGRPPNGQRAPHRVRRSIDRLLDASARDAPPRLRDRAYALRRHRRLEAP